MYFYKYSFTHLYIQVELIIDMLDLLYPLIKNKSKDVINENYSKFLHVAMCTYYVIDEY